MICNGRALIGSLDTRTHFSRNRLGYSAMGRSGQGRITHRNAVDTSVLPRSLK